MITMNESIYLCYKRTLTSSIAASLVFERLRNSGYAVYYTRKLRKNDFIQHIDKIIEMANDVIVLLDDRSFMALEEGNQRFLESWFAQELLEGLLDAIINRDGDNDDFSVFPHQNTLNYSRPAQMTGSDTL